MHTPSALTPVPPPRAVYWATQLLAWTLLIVLLGLYLFQSNLLSGDQVKVLVLFFFTGIGISHLFRWVIIHNRWLERDIGFVLPRLSLVALLLSILAFLVFARYTMWPSRLPAHADEWTVGVVAEHHQLVGFALRLVLGLFRLHLFRPQPA